MPPSSSPVSAARADVGARLAADAREGLVRERFVRDVLARVPLARVAELHLFAPLRQGGIESGVAVVAARPEAAPDEESAADAPRHTVYTARYRLAVRGPDRGRWQVDVREEADAPLVTVDAVVRGVQRRTGDASAPVRLDAAAVAELAAARADVAGAAG